MATSKNEKSSAWKKPVEFLDRTKLYVVEINDQSNDFEKGDLLVVKFYKQHDAWMDVVSGGGQVIHMEDIARYVELPD